MLSNVRLRVLLEVFRAGSIAGAARELGLSPSAVSHQLAKLEQETGVGLVERGAQRLRFTEAGAQLARRAQEVLDLVASAEQDLRVQARVDQGRLRIGFFGSAGYRLVPLALSRFSERHPGVELDLRLGQPHELLPELAGGTLDALVVFEHALEPRHLPDSVEVTPLLTEPQMLVVPQGHRVAGRAKVRLSELSGEAWITTFGADTSVSVFERACAVAGFTPRIRCRSDYYDVTIGLVRAGLGVAVVPCLGMQDAAGVHTCAIENRGLQRTVGVAVRPTNPNPALRPFTAHLRASAAAMRDSLERVLP
ncbi:LysR family transcriptional regulator [Sciscionella sediminilitoris]|uniref:LysR family transcriptional regulator n=1 Tax=Sciscionella sediminilitoris TaxID=1445613 RepID=UPI0004DF359C|nr:LysR family transcriptional regulator [Sciscionella sp. SE31]